MRYSITWQEEGRIRCFTCTTTRSIFIDDTSHAHLMFLIGRMLPELSWGEFQVNQVNDIKEPFNETARTEPADAIINRACTFLAAIKTNVARLRIEFNPQEWAIHRHRCIYLENLIDEMRFQLEEKLSEPKAGDPQASEPKAGDPQ